MNKILEEGDNMKINIFNVDRFITLNKLREITNPIYFNKGYVPTDDGLFSYEIFGRPGSYDRKTVFAYIDLKQRFLNPIVYKTLIRLNRKFDDCIAGRKYFDIINGELVENEEGKTGIAFLYKNWEKFVWKETDSSARTERITFLRGLKKDEAFMSKQLVVPPFYRDINYSDVEKGKIAHDVINDHYAKLIRLTLSLRETDEGLTGLSFIGNMTKVNIQMQLVEIYNYLIDKIKGKNGLFRQSIMGKNIDYAGRSVISAPSFNVNSYKDMKVTFESSGVPLSQLMNIFFPFFMKWLQDWFKSEYGYKKTIDFYNFNTGEYEVLKLVNPLSDYGYDDLKRKIDMFTKAPSERFDAILVNTERGRIPVYFAGRERSNISPSKESSMINRRVFTWTDLFYIAAEDICKDKHIYVTRYPVTDYLSIYPSKITVLSTFKVAPMILGDKFYPNYPMVRPDLPKEKVSELFIDALQLSNAMLSILGGDFDGDMVTIRGVFTQEANREAEKIIKSKRNILDISGKNIRSLKMEGIQTLYNLTKP